MLGVVTASVWSGALPARALFSFEARIPWRAYEYILFHPAEILTRYDLVQHTMQQEELDRYTITQLTNENATLQTALHYQKTTSHHLVLGHVVSYSVDPLLKTFIIDQGTVNGIQKGMAVVSASGFLLGTIDQVSARQSFVKQIQSSDMEFLVHAVGNNVPTSDFIARGMTNYVKATKIQNSQYPDRVFVVTSGLDGKFPPGLLVGEAHNFNPSTDHTFTEAIIDTDNEINTNVFVVTNATQ